MAQPLSRRLAPLALLLHIHTVSLASGRTSQVTGGKVQDLMPSWQPL
jgi:hypothetical protein